MITIGSNAFCCCRSNRSNRYTCPLHCLTLRCPPMRRGDIKVFAFIAPSSNNERLPVMCKSWNFESIFRPSAIHADIRVRNYTFHRHVVCRGAGSSLTLVRQIFPFPSLFPSPSPLSPFPSLRSRLPSPFLPSLPSLPLPLKRGVRGSSPGKF